jgi:hypothetical protein
MSLTLGEMKERLTKMYDPDDLLEVFEITTEDILNRFEDRLIRNLDSFYEEFEEEEEDANY